MTSDRQVEAQKLSADLQKYKQEVKVIGNELQVMTDKLQQTRDYVIKLYKDLHAAHDSRAQSGG
jgi:hypothetical protein